MSDEYVRTFDRLDMGRFNDFPEYKCPECGFVDIGGLVVSIHGYEGHYCMRCYAKWISENIPKMFRPDDHLAAKEKQ